MMRQGGRRRPRGQETPAGEEPAHRLSRSDIGAFRRLLGYVRPHARRLAVATLSLLVATLMSLVFPWIVRSLVDSVFVHHDERMLNLIAGGLFVIFLIQSLFNFAESYLIAWIGERIVADLRKDLFEHLQTLSADFSASIARAS